jgi:hypothetical protein
MTLYRYCTPEWLEASLKGFQENERLRSGLGKLSVKVCFLVKAEPQWGIDEDILFGGFVEQGELTRLSFFSPQEAARDAEFVLAAAPQEWKKILRKESKFVADFMLGKIKLTQGSKVGVLNVAPYSGALVDSLTLHELQFPDEMTPDELEQYRADVRQFRSELGV